MNQRQKILVVLAVGLVSAALWAWHASSPESDAKPAGAATTIPSSPFGPTRPAAFTEPSPPAPAPVAPAPPPQIEPVAATPDVDQDAYVSDPPDVDSPDPAERKFARGDRSDDFDQN